MIIIESIRKLSILPSRFKTMLEQGLLVVEDKMQREHLCEVACVISNAAWERWLSFREPEDNRQEHEWVVFANVMKIAECENLSLSYRCIATAFCFLHDTCFIKRIMEEDIRKLEEQNKIKEANELRLKKKNTRINHMKGGADNTRELLHQVQYPSTSKYTTSYFGEKEIDRCIDIVFKHDLWKVDPPEPPPTSDRLALVCLEGDALWPMHPLGVLADLERPNEKKESKDFSDPTIWRIQLQQSNKTFLEFRSKWKCIPAGAFIDSETIFRTREGWRLYSELRRLWNL